MTGDHGGKFDENETNDEAKNEIIALLKNEENRPSFFANSTEFDGLLVDNFENRKAVFAKYNAKSTELANGIEAINKSDLSNQSKEEAIKQLKIINSYGGIKLEEGGGEANGYRPLSHICFLLEAWQLYQSHFEHEAGLRQLGASRIHSTVSTDHCSYQRLLRPGQDDPLP